MHIWKHCHNILLGVCCQLVKSDPAILSTVCQNTRRQIIGISFIPLALQEGHYFEMSAASLLQCLCQGIQKAVSVSLTENGEESIWDRWQMEGKEKGKTLRCGEVGRFVVLKMNNSKDKGCECPQRIRRKRMVWCGWWIGRMAGLLEVQMSYCGLQLLQPFTIKFISHTLHHLLYVRHCPPQPSCLLTVQDWRTTESQTMAPYIPTSVIMVDMTSGSCSYLVCLCEVAVHV